jgi:hypothetical protein
VGELEKVTITYKGSRLQGSRDFKCFHACSTWSGSRDSLHLMLKPYTGNRGDCRRSPRSCSWKCINLWVCRHVLAVGNINILHISFVFPPTKKGFALVCNLQSPWKLRCNLIEPNPARLQGTSIGFFLGKQFLPRLCSLWKEFS